MILEFVLKLFTYDKSLDQSNLKAFADDNINVNQRLEFAFKGVENIVGKGKNIGSVMS